ncbi:MAG: DNA recombination protein RmuC [Deltaproteobacteria bacterium]|nr:DNA recombination protein RmuC [Deltaproteobacteria bacterium]
MITIDLLAALSILSFAALAAVAVFFVKYAGRQKKLTAEIIDRSLSEKDALTKEIIVFKEEAKALNGRLEAASGALETANALTEKLREENKNLFAKVSELTADNNNLNEKIKSLAAENEAKLERQKKEFLDFKEVFENLSTKILEEKSEKFLEINKNSISGILNPLSEKILEFQKKVEETYDKESKQRFSLQNEIKKLVETQDTMKQTTENLTTALKGTGKVQGDWGEMILEQLLEYSELIEGIQYEIQKTVKTTNEMDEKINLRPDVIVHLPKGRDLIIDSKVSLTDYERYMSLSSAGGGTSADAGADADKFLKSHTLSIKRHINELNDKKYSNLSGSKSIDSVIMFIPVEFAYTAAVNYDRELLTYAYSKNVIIATPSIVMLILKIVYNLWVQEKSQEKAAEVMELAGGLYDKFCSFAKSMEDVGHSIGKTAAAYDNAKGQLNSGKGNIMSRFEKIRLLGAKTSKTLDACKFDREDEGGGDADKKYIEGEE